MMPLRSKIGGHFVLSMQSFCNSVIVPFCNYVWNFNLAYNFKYEYWGLDLSHQYFTWQDLYGGTNIIDLMTWTLEFDLLFDNFHLANNFWTVKARGLIFWGFIETRHFRGYQHFWPCNTDLGVWPIFWKLLITFKQWVPEFSHFI